MYADVQSAYITLLKGRLGQSVQANELAPKAVRPYAGELADPERLFSAVPVALIDVAAAVDDELSEDEQAGVVLPTVDVILAASNASSGQTHMTDALKLASWARRALKSERPEVYNGRRPAPGRLRFQRLLTSPRLWVGRIQFTPRYRA